MERCYIGDLTVCDRICLLEVVGEVVAIELYKIDCRNWLKMCHLKGRGCTDMVFVVRQLVEKSCEHKSKAYFTFVDLKKAYDLVSREAMWLALNKLGRFVELIKSFHEETKVKIRLDGAQEINVHNGLRQGCCMA